MFNLFQKQDALRHMPDGDFACKFFFGLFT